jgi:signal transduction histidine kinase
MNSKAMPDDTYQSFLRDITERKRAEEILIESEIRLRELNATKDKFFSIIAHDLKSPFNSIIGFSNLLIEQIQEKDYDGIAEYATIIRNSSQGAMDLLQNLLEWSRSQTGRMEFNPEYVEIVSMIDETIHILVDAAKQKSIILSRELPRKAIAFADKDMISTVLRNLISNAIKFTNPGGAIIISAEQKQNELIIGVTDNGVGIKKDVLDKLFRVEESFSTIGTKNEKGTGLGLILCKEFITKHGGEIWVESKVGKGSMFCFTIPKS